MCRLYLVRCARRTSSRWTWRFDSWPGRNSCAARPNSSRHCRPWAWRPCRPAPRTVWPPWKRRAASCWTASAWAGRCTACTGTRCGPARPDARRSPRWQPPRSTTGPRTAAKTRTTTTRRSPRRAGPPTTGRGASSCCGPTSSAPGAYLGGGKLATVFFDSRDIMILFLKPNLFRPFWNYTK